MSNEEEMHNIWEWFKDKGCGYGCCQRISEGVYEKLYQYSSSTMRTEISFFEHLADELRYVIVRTSRINFAGHETHIRYAVLRRLKDVIKFTEEKLKEYRKLDSLIFK